MTEKYFIKLYLDSSGFEDFVRCNEKNKRLCYANQNLQDYNICYEEYAGFAAFSTSSIKLNMLTGFCEML
jgi:hypothetical protein